MAATRDFPIKSMSPIEARYPGQCNFLHFTIPAMSAEAKGNTSLVHTALVSIKKYLQKQS
jgi:hypothetical protein